jgi:hypothetical protein
MQEKPENPNDAVRRTILQYFYDRNAGATSRFGKRGSAIKISDVKSELKSAHGLSQQQVMSNLTYLIGRHWVEIVSQEKSVATPRGTVVPSVVTFYEISAQGIEKIEGPSEFEPREQYPGINIQATGSNVITLGDGNLVNVRYTQLFDGLTELQAAITASERISEESKLVAVVDVETLKNQLAKPEPDPEIASRLWPRIAQAADLAGLTSLAVSLAPLVQELIR